MIAMPSWYCFTSIYLYYTSPTSLCSTHLLIRKELLKLQQLFSGPEWPETILKLLDLIANPVNPTPPGSSFSVLLPLPSHIWHLLVLRLNYVIVGWWGRSKSAVFKIGNKNNHGFHFLKYQTWVVEYLTNIIDLDKMYCVHFSGC